MKDKHTTGKRSKIAAYLLKIKAVQISIDPPFTWSSGMQAPIYCDNRKTLSFPEVRTAIRDAFCEEIQSNYPEVHGLAGVATGGIAHAALVADQLGLPMVYIRSKAKAHGLKNLVEGKVEAGKSYVVIEDLISTGKSSLAAVKALLETGVHVAGTLSIFSYGFPKAQESFQALNQQFAPLTTLSELMEVAIEQKSLSERERAIVENWQKSPEKWKNS